MRAYAHEERNDALLIYLAQGEDGRRENDNEAPMLMDEANE